MIQRIKGYCALCISRCGSIAVVEDGRFVALEPDPSHPTGHAICAKGRAAPELVGRLIPSYRAGVSPGALWLRRRSADA